MLAIARSQSRVARSLRALVFIGLFGATLASYSAYRTSTDVRLATGARSEAQRAFYIEAAERPDLQLFYRGLTPGQRFQMAERLGEYSEAKTILLIGSLLDTFDEAAREVLASSLVKAGRSNPEAVADLLGISGGFQQLAISRALRDRPDHSRDLVAARLTKAEMRANAAAYLIGLGEESVPLFLAALDSTDHDVQMVAADALGKLRARQAVPALHRLYDATNESDRLRFTSALASIGDPTSESRLMAVLTDEAFPVSLRIQAALGLGRIGSSTAVTVLLPFVTTEDAQFRDNLIVALGSCGDAALAQIKDQNLAIRIAALVTSPRADETLRTALGQPATQALAIECSANRPALVDDLHRVATSATDGEILDRTFGALSTTPEGKRLLQSLRQDPHLGPWAVRELARVS